MKNDWVAVTDHLPPDGEYVLVYRPGEQVWPGRIVHGPVRAYWEDAEGYDTDPPTHWCPLPEPPMSS